MPNVGVLDSKRARIGKDLVPNSGQGHKRVADHESLADLFFRCSQRYCAGADERLYKGMKPPCGDE